MNARHTPGPWHWENGGNRLAPVNVDPSRSAVHSILDADGGYGLLGKPNDEVLAELDADRALIAAAPELLEALQAILSDGVHCDVVPHLHRKARAAIAKALGEEVPA